MHEGGARAPGPSQYRYNSSQTEVIRRGCTGVGRSCSPAHHFLLETQHSGRSITTIWFCGPPALTRRIRWIASGEHLMRPSKLRSTLAWEFSITRYALTRQQGWAMWTYLLSAVYGSLVDTATGWNPHTESANGYGCRRSGGQSSCHKWQVDFRILWIAFLMCHRCGQRRGYTVHPPSWWYKVSCLPSALIAGCLTTGSRTESELRRYLRRFHSPNATEEEVGRLLELYLDGMFPRWFCAYIPPKSCVEDPAQGSPYGTGEANPKVTPQRKRLSPIQGDLGTVRFSSDPPS